MSDLATDIAAAEALLASAPTEREARSAWLYRCWFHAAPIGDETPPPAHWPTRGAYRAAALPYVALEAGWRIAGPGGEGQVRIDHTDGRESTAALINIVLENPIAAPVPGARLQRRRWLEQDVGGFWHLWSEPWTLAPPERMHRLYLPLGPDAMHAAAAHLVAALPPDALWAMKLLSGPHIPGRRDNGVIYLPHGGLGAPFLGPLLAVLAPLLTGPRLRLTRLWRGGCVADDPGDGRSFGEAVSHTLAGIAAGPDFAARATAALAPLLGHLDA